MDASAERWYFSPVTRAPRAGSAAVRPAVAFHRTKYGRELLVDAAFVRQMPTFRGTGAPAHTLAFHDIVLVTRGRGRFILDGEAIPVAPGTVLFSRPGEVRRWAVPGLDGACLFFAEEFLAAVFHDARFLEQFPYFGPGRKSPALLLAAGEQRTFRRRFAAMQKEIAAQRADASHALRAVLYELLVLLGRWYAAAHGAPASPGGPGVVERFRGMVEREFASRHRVSEYATELGVSAGHLNALCRGQLRRSPSAWIHGRLALEARRLLVSSDLTVAQVADRLGFADPAYFARFFRRETGHPPAAFRRAG